MLKSQLDTPSLILDLDQFERNLAAMRDFAKAAGKKLRPHAKTHKCPEIAKRQLPALLKTRAQTGKKGKQKQQAQTELRAEKRSPLSFLSRK